MESRENAAGIRVVGRRLERAARSWFAKGVCYGPFPTDEAAGWFFDADRTRRDFARVRESGFDCVRTFHPPTDGLMEEAARAGLVVWAGLDWAWQIAFGPGSGIVEAAEQRMRGEAARWRGHPALAGWVVANEIQPDMVRWLGEDWVRRALDRMILAGRAADPGALFWYAGFPLSEWLVPDAADLLGMNLYLEDEEALRRYLRRLHLLAGHRPLMIGEFGIDRLRHGDAVQAEWLGRAIRAGWDEGACGLMWFNWSDAWRDARTNQPVTGWRFGLTDEKGSPHPAMGAAAEVLAEIDDADTAARTERLPGVSVIVCTRNGGGRLMRCLDSLADLDYPEFEVVVVDDGSNDGTSGKVASGFPELRLVRQEPMGLAVARNTGAAAARFDWLAYLDDDCLADRQWLAGMIKAAIRHGWPAVGGPNLPPPERDTLRTRILVRLPGSAAPVLLDDLRAEHIPGCNLMVRRDAFARIGGFDARYRIAGDDVDFCWRLLQAGFDIGYAANAFLWHERRHTFRAFLRQQYHYGRAEAMLARSDTRTRDPASLVWTGVVYDGLPKSAAALFRSPGEYPVVYGMMPEGRPHPGADAGERLLFLLMKSLQPWARWLGRWSMHGRAGLPRMGSRDAGEKFVRGGRVEAVFLSPPGADHQGLKDLLAAMLTESGHAVEPDNGWHEWDLSWTGGSGQGQALFVTEYTEHPRQYCRVRIWGTECQNILRLLNPHASKLGYEMR